MAIKSPFWLKWTCKFNTSHEKNWLKPNKKVFRWSKCIEASPCLKMLFNSTEIASRTVKFSRLTASPAQQSIRASRRSLPSIILKKATCQWYLRSISITLTKTKIYNFSTPMNCQLFHTRKKCFWVIGSFVFLRIRTSSKRIAMELL